MKGSGFPLLQRKNFRDVLCTFASLSYYMTVLDELIVVMWDFPAVFCSGVCCHSLVDFLLQVEKIVTIMSNPRQYKIPDWFLNRQKDIVDGKYSQVFNVFFFFCIVILVNIFLFYNQLNYRIYKNYWFIVSNYHLWSFYVRRWPLVPKTTRSCLGFIRRVIPCLFVIAFAPQYLDNGNASVGDGLHSKRLSYRQRASSW